MLPSPDARISATLEAYDSLALLHDFVDAALTALEEAASKDAAARDFARELVLHGVPWSRGGFRMFPCFREAATSALLREADVKSGKVLCLGHLVAFLEERLDLAWALELLAHGQES